MKEPFQHPLDNLYPNNSLLLLEALIPYVDTSLKFPLAMLIKMQELRYLMQAFQNPSCMEACGFNRGTENSEEMLTSLCKIMGFDFQEKLKQLQSMQNMMNTMHMMNTMQGSFTETASPNITEPPSNDTFQGFQSDSKTDMITAIRQILSEQEGESYEPRTTTPDFSGKT